MRTNHIFALMASMVFVSGCAVTPTPEDEAKWERVKSSIPSCSSDKECALKWDAAQLWVVKNAGYKIQTATNVIIETYNSVNSSTLLAVRVTKEPAGQGKYFINITVWCDNMFGCSRDKVDAILDFNSYVGKSNL